MEANSPMDAEIDIRQQPLTEELKKHIYQGFNQHNISMIGYDEKFDAIAFIATYENQFVGD